jgi:transposase
MKRKKVVFKHYDQNQPMLLPPSFDDLVPENHPVRVVNEVIERIDISSLEDSYKGGGASSYHPRMLLKVLVYAYLRNIYSSRKIEQALAESVHFMWLSGNARPDHNTIADFRSKRLKDHLRRIFSEVVVLLAGEGVISLREATLDGTKIEANANRYTFVWEKTVKRSKQSIREQLREVWKYVERVCRDEEQMPNEPDFEAVDPEAVARAVEAIDEALAGRKTDAKMRAKVSRMKREFPARAARLEKQERMLGGRRSCSKTDPDATFMRMKEDHLGNGQLKPAYNAQLTTEEHYVTGYSLTQSPGDTTALPGHIEQMIEDHGVVPESLTADAGYGSEENYDYLEQRNIKGYVKYNTFDREQKKRRRIDPFKSENLNYDETTDTLYCPSGQPMRYIGDQQRTTRTGRVQTVRKYQAAKCAGCPMRSGCHKSRGNRVIERNPEVVRYRLKAREMLESEEGVARRKKRYMVEAVIGNVKENKKFRRFLLRGLEKVTAEFGLVMLAHNLQTFAIGRAN